MDVERFITVLKQEQSNLALQSLRVPRNRDSFEFGLVSGLIQAYDRILESLEEQVAEASGRQKPEPRPARMENPYLTELDHAPVLPEQMGRKARY